MRLKRDAIRVSLVIDLPDEADFEASCWLKETLHDVCRDFEGLVILNLKTVTTLGSHCIGTMITFSGHAGPRKVEIRIVCPDGNVRRQIEHSRLDQILPVYDTLDEALSAPRSVISNSTRIPVVRSVSRTT